MGPLQCDGTQLAPVPRWLLRGERHLAPTWQRTTPSQVSPALSVSTKMQHAVGNLLHNSTPAFFRCGDHPWALRQTWQDTLHRSSQHLTVVARRDLASTASSRKSCAGILSIGCERCNPNITDKCRRSPLPTTHTWHTRLRCQEVGTVKRAHLRLLKATNDGVGEVGDVRMARCGGGAMASQGLVGELQMSTCSDPASKDGDCRHEWVSHVAALQVSPRTQVC